MENIRNIKEKIKSCLSCNEDQCPFIKERLERHVLSHHSSSKQTLSNQPTKPGRLSGTLLSKSALTMTTSNEETSTSDLITEQLNKRSKQTMYREGLDEIINEWAKQLPKYLNANILYLKQNIVNELIEKLSNLSREANEGYYDLKLAIEIDKFIDSLPTIPDTSESDLANLKEILVGKICDLNTRISWKDMNRIDKKQEKVFFIKKKENGANTQQSFKNNLKYLERQKDNTSTPYSSLSDNNESITDLNFKEKPRGKKLVDAQVQQSFSSFKPFYGDMFKKPVSKIDKQQNTNVIENVYKQIISNWLDYLTRKLDQNEKKIVTDAVLNRLRPLLDKNYTINHKILLKTEILNCLNDYMFIIISPENYSQTNRIADDLAVKLLDAKFNQEEVNSMLSRSCFPNSKDKMLAKNFEPENYLDLIVQNIVSEKLGSLNISNLIKRDIINIILQNMKLICMRQDHYIEALIFDIFQHYTELSDYSISNIVKSILDEIRIVATNNYLHIYNSVSNYDSYKLCRPSLISVYKSEHEIRGPSVSFRKMAEQRSNHLQLTEDEKTYIDNISELINAWMTTLPAKASKVSKKTKEGIIKNLSQDILDQVKLGYIVPETKEEKEKYLSFFIHRALNRLNCFEDISDAQPFAEEIIKKIKNVPEPSISKNQTLDNGKEKLPSPKRSSRTESLVSRGPIKNNSHTKDKYQNIANTLKSEAILKEFLAKYIEHNYDEDNPLAREVFGHILKTELKKLSTPTRNKVYGDLNNQKDHMLTSEKIAKDLQYINIISDWFKILPLESLFNVTGNTQRAQYVNDLAKIISNLEQEQNRLTEMDYKKQLNSTVTQFMDNLPITKTNSQDMSFLIDDFINKIASLRSPTPEFGKELSLNVSKIPDQNLSDFIEGYIRDNGYEVSDDELKLDAWALRLLGEVDNMASENPSALSTSQVYNRLADISVQGDDLGKRFNLELSYAKEISNWINNLPLQRIVDQSAKDLRIQMISDLAEKMSARWHIKNKDPNNTQVDVDLVNYIEKWIRDLPLDRNKELNLPLLIQQISNRMERVNTGKQTLPLIQQEPQNNKINICKSPQPCGDNHVSRKQNMADPGGAIVEAIESWCKKLPIQSESVSDNNTLKEEFATNLYKKVGELNKNPDYFDNNFLYLQNLGEEIDLGFDKLPQNPLVQNTRQELKKQLLDIIEKNRNLMSEKAAGVQYREELANTIEMSLPNPSSLLPKHSPGFNIYRNRLAELFILENFDRSQNDDKLNYVKRLRNELDKYFPEAQIMNSLPLTKEQMFNELYSSLFSVPPPDETSIIEEVEEVKTKCEIENWFESLPIRKATGFAELLERDQILSMLAKRLHHMEKYERKPDNDIHKEITKWFLKLPIMPGQEENINIFANELQQRLKLTYNNRMCKPRNPNLLEKESMRNKLSNKGVLGTSQVAGPSSDGMPWLSPPSYPSPENMLKAPKRPSDLILDIVETWCRKIPLAENTQQEKENARLLKDNLVVKLIMKISELNVNPETFENDILYDIVLDDELDNLISTLPTSNELIQNKTVLKNQLKDAIKSIKPLIMEEKARYEYKQKLKNTVDQVLKQPPNLPPEKVALFITLRDEIVDNFVAYSFCKDDEEGQGVHKMMVHNAVEKYYVGKKSVNSEEVANPLIKGNQLLCELAKVPAPSAGVILEEIHEIRMKFQITDLFEELSFTDDANKLALKNQVKSTLARRLSDFDKTSFIQNRAKVRDDIMRSLHKLQNEIDPQKVEMFIEKLENFEKRRISQLPPDDQNNLPISYNIGENVTNNENLEDKQFLSLLPAPISHNIGENVTNNENLSNKQWLSLLPAPISHNIGENVTNNENLSNKQWSSLLPAPISHNIGGNVTNNENLSNTPRLSLLPAPISHNIGENVTNNENLSNKQWLSLLQATPRVHDPEHHDTVEFREFRKSLGEVGSPQALGNAFDHSISPSGISYDKFKGGEPLSSSVTNKQQPIQSLSNSSDKPRNVVPDQNQGNSVPGNDVISQGYQTIDNNANRYLETSPRSRNISSQSQNLESQNILPKTTQQTGGRPDLQKNFNSRQSRNTDLRSQEQIRSQIRNKSYTLIQDQSAQSQGSQQSRRMTPNYQNEMSMSPTIHQSHSIRSPSQITLQEPDVPSQHNLYITPSPLRQPSAPQNIPGPCSALPTDLLQPMPQLSSQTPYFNPRCNKSCRRPSIMLINPPLCNNNQSMRGNIGPISDDEESIICSCTNKRKKRCRGNPVCPIHMRKQCKICNGINPFYCAPPYRRYCRY